MPVCPRCRIQFSDDTDKCPYCKVLLLGVVQGDTAASGVYREQPRGHGPEAADDSPEKLLLLLEEPLPEMAAMIKEFLQNCGIDCIVHSESIGLLYRLPAPGAPISRARLYVRESDYHEARELVTNFFKKT